MRMRCMGPATTALLLSTLSGACGGGPVGVEAPELSEAVQVPLEQDVTLGLDEVAWWPGGEVAVAFRALEEDSRCPEDVTCVWSGDARVALDVLYDDRVERARLHTHLEPRSWGRDLVSLLLVDVLPHPVSETSMPRPAPKVVLRVTVE